MGGETGGGGGGGGDGGDGGDTADSGVGCHGSGVGGGPGSSLIGDHRATGPPWWCPIATAGATMTP